MTVRRWSSPSGGEPRTTRPYKSTVSPALSWYQRGLIYAQVRRPDESLSELREAVAKGFKDVARMKSDATLDPLRARVDFKKLLADLERERHPASTTRQSGS